MQNDHYVDFRIAYLIILMHPTLIKGIGCVIGVLEMLWQNTLSATNDVKT